MSSTFIEDKTLDLEGEKVPIWLARPFQLVSLLEMLNAYAVKFYEIGKGMAFFRAALGEETIFDAQLPDNAKKTLITNLQSIVEWCQEIGLHSVARYAHNCLATPTNELTFKKAHKIVEGLQERFVENLGRVYFKFVPSNKAILYSAPFPFGPKVANNFSSANYDIEEASKCLALDRYTACIMHLMRALEVALDATGLGVGIPSAAVEAHNSWERLLRKTVSVQGGRPDFEDFS
jgi:hypothetical protein